MTGNTLELRGISYCAGGKRILEGVSFKLGKGDFCCLIGPNGVGKSTLLKSIIRIITPDNGDIFVADKKVSSYSQKELAKIVSYVPQKLERIPSFTVKEFIAMSRFPYSSFNCSLSCAEAEKVEKILNDVDLSEFCEANLPTLSGGELQRVMIAAALVQEAGILLLDEPFASQDPHHQEEIFNLLNSLKNNNGLTVLCVCHDLNIAVRLSERIISLKSGKVTFDGKPANFLDGENIENLYGTEFVRIDSGIGQLPLLFTKGVIDA